MSGWSNLPVTTGLGPVPPAGSTSGSSIGSSPTDLQSWKFWNQFHDALEAKSREQSNDCDVEFPPVVYFAQGTISGVTINSNNSTATFSFTSVNWPAASGCRGSRWGPGYSCSDCLNYIPADYSLVAITDFDDPFTWTRADITASTFDSNESTGTITTSLIPLQNAVAAKFISSVTALGSAKYRIVKQGTGVTSRERRPLKPNQKELWRGVVVTGWIDDSGNGQIQELNTIVDPSPYDSIGGSLPLVVWGNDLYKAQDIIFSDATGRFQRKTVAGNLSNQVGFGDQIYKVAVTATSGTFNLSATPSASNTSGASISPAYNASASTLQTDFSAFSGMSGVTVTGLGPFVITFPSSMGFVGLTGVGATVGIPDTATAFGGNYIIVASGTKGAPGRIPEQFPASSFGVREPFITHNPDSTQGTAYKLSYTSDWLEGSPCGGGDCVSVVHTVLDTDAQIEIDSECEPGRAGDFLAVDFYKTPRGLQVAALSKLSSFVDIWNPWGDFLGGGGPNYFTPATYANGAQAAYGISLNAWSAGLSVNGSTGTTAAPPFTPPQYPVSIYWTILDSHRCNKASGTAQIDASGNLTGGWGSDSNGLTILMWAGPSSVTRARVRYLDTKMQFIVDCGIDPSTELPACYDPPAITPGGSLATPDAPTLSQGQAGNMSQGTVCAYRISSVNASGETLASAEVTIVCNQMAKVNGSAYTITTPTYSVNLAWVPQVGASSVNIYGRTSGGELLMTNVSSYSGTWTDDGSIDPSGALPTSNTTSTDCFGTGFYICRDISAALIGVSANGFVGDGYNISTGTIARYQGDNPFDPFSGRGAITVALEDASYYDRLFRGRYPKSIERQRNAHLSGPVTYGTRYSILDAGIDWSIDGVNNGLLRVQGGLLTAGGTTTLADSDYNNEATSKSCWFNPGRYNGKLGGVNATPYSFFIIETYAGGMPAGWTFVEDGSATYTAPTANGSTGTIISGYPPTINSITPTPVHATGELQPIFLQGNNFQPGCTVTFTLPDSSTMIVTPRTIAPGELTLWVSLPRGQSGSWTATASNPTAGPSAAFMFSAALMQTIPIQSFGGAGVFSLSATLDTGAGASDGYLIREYRYEQNRWRAKVVRITQLDGTILELPCRFSNRNELFFDEQSTAMNGSYSIKQIPTGASLRIGTAKPTIAANLLWCEGPPDGTTHRYWVQPTGDDSRLSGAKFDSNPAYVFETKLKGNGLWNIYDELHGHIPNELYYMIRSMTTRETGASPHNYGPAPDMTPQANINNRDTGINGDQGYGDSAGQWSATGPVAGVIGPCGGQEIHSGAVDGTLPGADNIDAGADAETLATEFGHLGGCMPVDCNAVPLVVPDSGTQVSGPWNYAYYWAYNVLACYPSSLTLWLRDGGWPDSSGTYYLGCTDDGVDYTVAGELTWAGNSIGLLFNGWASMGGLSGGVNQSTGRIGSEPTPVDWLISGAPPTSAGASVSTGYNIVGRTVLQVFSDSYD